MSEQTGQQGTSQQQLQAQVVERASKDQEFRRQLLQNPKETLQQTFDVQIPEFIAIEVKEESPSRIYLVLPPGSQEVGQELSDRDLEAVAGGWTEPTFCACPSANCPTDATNCFTCYGWPC